MFPLRVVALTVVAFTVVIFPVVPIRVVALIVTALTVVALTVTISPIAARIVPDTSNSIVGTFPMPIYLLDVFP